MADRSIVVRLRAEVTDFKRSMADAAQASDKTSAAFDRNGQKIDTMSGRMVRSAQVNREAWMTAGTALTAFGVAGVAALGFSAKAAMDWETAWTGVLKTVEGSHDELAQLEDDLRALALVKPASQIEIAAVAEAAGQLGVATKDVAEFTSVMIDLGETTNLTSEEAATSLAQLMNIMQTASGDVDRLGSAVVALGNNGASTERDIVQMAQRIAGAGKIVGLTEGEVLGLANALASVGIEVEAGGSAISKIMIDISKAVSEGGDDLIEWARVAGMTSDDFARKWQYAPAEALASVVEGLGDLNTAGEDVFGTMESLGQSEVRVTRALLSMANSGDLLRDSLNLGNDAWAENNALVEEAEKRYDTTEAKVSIARNSINEAAIEIGEHLLPLIAGLSEGLADLAQWFASLPEPLQRAIVGFGGIASVAALAAGGFLLLFPRVIDTIGAFKTLNTISPGVASGITKVSKAAGLAAAALAAMAASSAIPKWGVESSESVALTTKALLEMADGAELADTTIGDMLQRGGFKDWFTGNDIASVEEAWRNLTAPSVADGFDNVASSILTLGQSTSTARLQSQQLFSDIDAGLASLVQSGAPEEAAAALEALGIPIEVQAELLPQYTGALADTENQQVLNADATTELADATEQFSDALEESLNLQREQSGIALDEWDALTRYADAVYAATAAIETNGAGLDAWTEQGRANRDSLTGIADATWDWIEAGAAAGESQVELGDRMAEGRQALIDTAIELGATEEDAIALADSFNLIPANVTTIIYADTSQARAALNTLRTMYDDIQWGNYNRARTGYADGGAVHGPGTGTSDSIAANLSNGEHVITAREVAGAGGHGAIESMRSVWRKGFADGGAVYAASPMSMSASGSGFDGSGRMHPADLYALTSAMTVNVGIGSEAIANAANKGNLVSSALGGN